MPNNPEMYEATDDFYVGTKFYPGKLKPNKFYSRILDESSYDS